MSTFHVLMCTHNGSKYVAEQITSIIEQDVRPSVIHVHDFRSSDGTLELLNKLASTSPVTIHITSHQDAPGASRSFFRAMEELAPKLSDDDVVFLSDQDDVWLPGKARCVHEHFSNEKQLTQNKNLLMFHDVTVVGENLQKIRSTYYTGNPFDVPRDLTPERLLLANAVIGHTMAVSGSLLRLVVKAASAERYLMHDWALSLFASRFGRIVFIPHQLSLYRQHSNNVLGAYKAKPLRVVLRRLPRFVSGVVDQAVAFIKDCQSVSEVAKSSHVNLDERLQQAIGHNGFMVSVLLAISAATRGPTLKRKLLAFYIAAHAVLNSSRAARS